MEEWLVDIFVFYFGVLLDGWFIGSSFSLIVISADQSVDCCVRAFGLLLISVTVLD